MKKVISMLLVVSLLFGAVIPVCAESKTSAPQVAAASTLDDVQAAIDCEYPIIFVTGIGQTWSHLVDENGNYKANSKSDLWNYNLFDREEDPIDYNLFYPDSNAFKDPKVLFATLRLVGEVLLTLTFKHNFVSKKDVSTIFSGVLSRNIIDENGNLPPDVEDCSRPYPISEYNDIDLENFYFSIPCQSIVQEIGAENIFCFYHSAFSFLYNDADDLDKFINDAVLGKYSDADKVVLIPMSMGATVVNAYLDRYGSKGQVARVVSIVGAWNGSDVIADLVEGKFAENAPELLYNGALLDAIDEPWNYVANIALRILPKKTLRSVIDTLVSAVVESIILPTPSMLALMPGERYAAVEQKLLMDSKYDKVREQARAYNKAQLNLIPRLRELEANGTEFFFICGYGFEFGGGGGGYEYFRFMQSAPTTNSDEIIQISSTAPGTTFAPAGQKLGKSGEYVSPDGSIDLSTSFAPDRTWCFFEQKHELEFNNTALRLALDISTGRVKSVRESADTYPQFNESRNAKPLLRGDVTYLTRLQDYIDANKSDPSKAENVQIAQDALDACNAMLAETHNNREADDAVIENAYQTLIKLGLEQAPDESEPSAFNQFLTRVFKKLNDRVYDTFGAAGFLDKIFH